MVGSRLRVNRRRVRPEVVARRGGRTDAIDRVTQDLDALSGIAHRYAGTEGEREMLHAVRNRLPEGDASRIEGFVAYTSPGLVIGVHALSIVVVAVVGLWWPLFASVACVLLTGSLVLEGTGRFSMVRSLLLKSASYNLVWRRETENAQGTLVISAPLDRPRWRPNRPRWLKRPMRAVLFSAAIVTVLLTMRAFAEPWGRPTQGMYAVALLVLTATVVWATLAHRRKSKAAGGASGCAAALELLRRFREEPPAGLDVWFVFTGCSYAFQNGMHAFLAMRGDRPAKPVFVLSLTDPGKQTLQATISEGLLVREPHRPTGPALVERLRWAGVDLPAVDMAVPTDAWAATQRGYRALALVGGAAPTTPQDTLRAVEIAEAICHLYAQDVQRAPEVRTTVQARLTATPSVG